MVITNNGAAGGVGKRHVRVMCTRISGSVQGKNVSNPSILGPTIRAAFLTSSRRGTHEASHQR